VSRFTSYGVTAALTFGRWRLFLVVRFTRPKVSATRETTCSGRASMACTPNH